MSDRGSEIPQMTGKNMGKVLYLRREAHIGRLKAESGKHYENSIRDQLTGLFNRRYFDDFMEKKMKSADGHKFALVMLDIDHFKDFNDKHSHKVGDEALQYVARVLLSHTREKDVLARYGGEEFIILLEDTEGDKNILGPATRLQSAFDELDVNPERCFKITESDGSKTPVNLTISAGVTAYYSDTDEGEWKRTLLRSDMALHEAKFKRNDVVFYGHVDAFDLSNNIIELRRNNT